MQLDLGATKRILDVSAGKCQLEGGRWWKLGLLDAGAVGSPELASGWVMKGPTVRSDL